MRAAVVGLDAASGEAASHTCACARVFTYLLDLKYVYLLSSAEGARAAVVGLHVASGEAVRVLCMGKCDIPFTCVRACECLYSRV